ncbi:MAG: hypothetical protein V2A67_03830 [Bacteroidota bacterium]
MKPGYLLPIILLTAIACSRPGNSISLESIRVYPDIQNRIIKVTGEIRNSSPETHEISLTATVHPYQSKSVVMNAVRFTKEVPAGSEFFELYYPMGDSIISINESDSSRFQLDISLKIKKTGETILEQVPFAFTQSPIPDGK